jgi:hypothetical protein
MAGGMGMGHLRAAPFFFHGIAFQAYFFSLLFSFWFSDRSMHLTSHRHLSWCKWGIKK